MGIWQNFEVPNYILIRQAVSPIRKAVVADRHNPIAVITLSLTLRLLDLFVHLWTSLAALQPLLNLSRIQARLDPSIDQNVMRSDILLIFEIRSEKLLNHSCLDGWRFNFAKLNKTMRIPRIAGFSAKLKVDTVAFAQLCKTLLHHLSASLAKSLKVIFIFINSCLWRIRIQVKWIPGR